jgi:hypothetical protein
MIIQLLSISKVYNLFNIPWVLTILAYQCGLPDAVVHVASVYAGFLLYDVIFPFSFKCCLSLSGLQKNARKYFYAADEHAEPLPQQQSYNKTD